MKKSWFVYIPIVLSAFALALSFFVIFQTGPHKMDEYGSQNLLISSLSIIVTILIGWQITTVINLKDERRKWETIIRKNDRRFDLARKDVSDNLIALSCIIAASSRDSVYERVNSWLEIIETCNNNKEAIECIKIASTFIANEFITIWKSNSKLDELGYKYLWQKSPFEIFLKVSVDNKLLPRGALAIVEETLRNIHS